MNPIALYLWSGDTFFWGTGLLVTAIAISPMLKRKWQLRTRNIAFYLAVIAMVIASPPFEWITDSIFVSSAILWFITWNYGRSGAWLRSATALVALAITIGMSVAEFSHRKMPTLSGASDNHIVIIGDSLSAGLDSRVPTWPSLFQQSTGVTVKNLAIAGATTVQGITMARELTSEDQIVVLEIGGNDLFSSTQCNVFARNLGLILDTVVAHGRTVVMFELPILPYQIPCGRYQRQLASKYHVNLIPKHYLTQIMASPNATSDGVHLTRDWSDVALPL